MSRNWIVVGDPTSSGGSVITGSPFTDIDGIPVARVNDQATCPRHKGAYPIVDGDSTMIVDGQPVALHGSSLSCGCKVLSAQQVRVFVDYGTAAGAAMPGDPSVTAGAPMSEALRAPAAQEPAEAFVGFDGRNSTDTTDPGKARDTQRDANTALRDAGAYRAYESEVEAARAWRQYVLPVADDHQVEIGAIITRTPDGEYHLGPAYSNGAYDNVNGLLERGRYVEGSPTAYIHTHPYPGGWVGADRALSYDAELSEVRKPDGTVDLLGGSNMGPDTAGDLVVAYNEKLNAYIADSSGLYGFDYHKYVEMQRQEIRLIRLGEAYWRR